MKKTELIDAVASATGQTKKATEETVNALLGVVEKSLLSSRALVNLQLQQELRETELTHLPKKK